MFLFVLSACFLTAGLIFFNGKANAQNKKADTISSGDVQFTSIPTAQDSIAMRKKALAKEAQNAANDAEKLTQAAQTAANRQAKLNANNPQSLWDIFWTGLAGGFAAVVMPCIYPLLPLTVAFLQKKPAQGLKV